MQWLVHTGLPLIESLNLPNDSNLKFFFESFDIPRCVGETIVVWILFQFMFEKMKFWFLFHSYDLKYLRPGTCSKGVVILL